MNSYQVLVKDDQTAVLEPGRLVLTRDGGRIRTEIPLAVVRRAGQDGETGIRVHLTDAKIHWIQGGNATATAAFLAALRAALPEEPDPAGSALVVTEEKEPVRAWIRWAAGGLALLAYGGYVLRVFVAHGAFGAFTTALGVPALLLGLRAVQTGVRGILLRVRLARTGITVVGVRERRPDGTPGRRLRYTDLSGNEYVCEKSGPGATAHIVYDPDSPRDGVVRQPLARVAGKYLLGFTVTLVLLGFAVAWLVLPYRA